MAERLFIQNYYLPLSQGLNPSINKSITDINEPEKRKAAYTKSVSVPNSKEASKVFSEIFELNRSDLTFNVSVKADCYYEVDSEIIIFGYCQLKDVTILHNNDIAYEIVIYSETADFFAELRDKYLHELDLSQWNHPFTKEIQQKSWATEVFDADLASLVPFAYGKGYVYPLIDYGLSTSGVDYTFTQIGCAIYLHEYFRRIISEAGYTYTSTFVDSTLFKHLIIPSSPEVYALTSDEIADREFAANTPEFNSTGTTTTNNLPYNTYSALDKIIFTVEVNDAGGNYDNTTGIFTVVSAGTYDINALIDINATFTPATGVGVKNRGEIDGFIETRLTPLSTGTEVLINQVPFFITTDDSTFFSGARSTSTTPTYPDTDYLDNKAYSIHPNAPLIGRGVNPPDRYQVAVSGVQLQAGDQIRIVYKAGYFRKTAPLTYSALFFDDSGGNGWAGDAVMHVSVASFYTKAVNSVMAEGNTLQIEKIIQKNIKQTDFFTSVLKMFNLWIDADPANEKNLIIKTRDTYLGTDELNIHELIDRSKPFKITPMGALDVRRFIFKYKEDKDYYNDLYTSEFSEIYGQRRVDTVTEFYNQDKETNIIFSPTVLVAQPNSDFVLPTIYQMTDTGVPKPVKHNIRILYYDGLKSCTNVWNHINYVSGWPYLPIPTPYTTYPFAGHIDDAFNPTLDINFGMPYKLYYDDNLQAINYTNNNLVNAYHSRFLREITDPESRIVRCYVRLSPAMYTQFTFDKLYFFDYAWFRLQDIEGYNPTSEETVLCTFLKINDASEFNADTFPVDGDPAEIDPDQLGGDVDMSEGVPVKGDKSSYHPDNNTYYSKTVTAQGKNNVVGNKSQYVEIYGDYNKVFDETENIKIQGSGNTVEAGLSNVTLINTNDITVTESNVTYIDGKRQGYWETKTSDFNPSVDVEGYFIDATSNDVTAGLTEVGDWIFKRLDNSVFIASIEPDPALASGIDGDASQELLQYESIRVKYNNGEFSIIN